MLSEISVYLNKLLVYQTTWPDFIIYSYGEKFPVISPSPLYSILREKSRTCWRKGSRPI